MNDLISHPQALPGRCAIAVGQGVARGNSAECTDERTFYSLPSSLSKLKYCLLFSALNSFL